MRISMDKRNAVYAAWLEATPVSVTSKNLRLAYMTVLRLYVEFDGE